MVITGLGSPALILAIGRALNYLPISILYLFATFPLVLATVGSLVPSLAPEKSLRKRVAAALMLILGASLAPSTVSHLRDGTRFDYRPALQRIVAEDPRGTVLIWPLIEATWHAPDLTAVELRSSTSVRSLDSLASATRQFWVVSSRRRYGIIHDGDESKARWLERRCDRIHTQEKMRFDWEVYGVTLFKCGGSGS
jgi:hypothetical protein